MSDSIRYIQFVDQYLNPEVTVRIEHISSFEVEYKEGEFGKALAVAYLSMSNGKKIEVESLEAVEEEPDVQYEFKSDRLYEKILKAVIGHEKIEEIILVW